MMDNYNIYVLASYGAFAILVGGLIVESLRDLARMRLLFTLSFPAKNRTQ